MDYRIDLPSLFDRLQKNLEMYCGPTVYYRVVSNGESSLPVEAEYFLEAFSIVGFVYFKGEQYAVCFIQDSYDAKKKGKISYLEISEFERGDVFDKKAAALLSMQYRKEGVV